MSKLAVLADWYFTEHETGRHPENADRLRVVYERLQAASLVDGVPTGKVQPAAEERVVRVHSRRLVERVRSLASQGGGRIEADTVVSPESYRVALCAVQAACEAVDRVLTGDADRALCLVRPPGHHATRDRAMGFCLFNNVACAAAHALAEHGLERVLIVDWDVHHGNGTQAIFYDDPRVVFFSVHRYPFYPGTGREKEIGTGPGLGTTFNLPLPFGTPREEYRRKFRQVLRDAARRCKPELVLVSAGFDAHTADPIGSLGLEAEDYTELTKYVLEVAEQYCNGRVVSVLEGGYHLEGLANSVECHARALRG